jgi:hypothetical protein
MSLVSSIMKTVYEILAKQKHLFCEMVNLTKYTFKSIQNFISDKKILSISTETIIKCKNTYTECKLFLI